MAFMSGKLKIKGPSNQIGEANESDECQAVKEKEKKKNVDH